MAGCVSYAQVWTALKNTDQDPANAANVIELYTGKSIAKTRNGGNAGDQDPPDTFEQRRNEVIYSTYQHNRNPFIDHPEWVESIW